ncbi:glycosyltransferase family 4 protein [Chloroflexota bacterium]
MIVEALAGRYGQYTNKIYTRLGKAHSRLFYITEAKDWSIKWDARYITGGLRKQNLIKVRITVSPRGIHDQILHFGSRNLFLPDAWANVDTGNNIVFTWYHGTEKDASAAEMAMIGALPGAAKRADVVHTACALSRTRLTDWGVPEEKIVIVPIGVDLNLFKPVSDYQRQSIRQKLGLPRNKVIIGSFQKDGVGWGEGIEPKWIKGPDVFLEVMRKLKEKHDLFVLLTGPARGYVKKGLNMLNIPYKHFYLKDYRRMPDFYHALDLYLVTSREEGGPRSVLEAMASGVPLVSTRVGMAIDVVRNGFHGLLADPEDVDTLAKMADRVIADRDMAHQLAGNSLIDIQDYSWENIAMQYYNKIYRRFLYG